MSLTKNINLKKLQSLRRNNFFLSSNPLNNFITNRMKKITLAFVAFLTSSLGLLAQTNPAITSWLQNTTTTGYYYVGGNSTPISHGILVNCQKVEYSTNSVYISATGIPAYHIGPYLDGNPNQAGNQNAIFKLPLNPTENAGTKSATTGGNIGILIDGTAVFDFRDGVAWNTTTNTWCGGPGNSACPGGPGATQSWMRDAVVFENDGFDCAKGHPAGTNYHHHQNPSAFKLDVNVVSTICNLYDADGLYTINPTEHSPLIGFAYDGFPIYGAYGYANADGTGGITRIKSGYQLRNITVRTHHADGTDVGDGPPVNATYPIGTFREDYEWIAHPGDASYLDIHNGRFCKTPEYPEGIYCYFATVDENYNSVYPYLIGPTFYGNKTGTKVTSVTETTTVYTKTVSINEAEFNKLNINIFPNPTSDLIAIQIGGINQKDLAIGLYDMQGKLINETKILKGQTIGYFDIQTLYSGAYLIKISSDDLSQTRKIIIER